MFLFKVLILGSYNNPGEDQVHICYILIRLVVTFQKSCHFVTDDAGSCDLLRAHSPSVQFLLSIMLPLQWRPPLRGGGAWHSRLRQCVHSVPHADHLDHSVQPPSTRKIQNQRLRSGICVNLLVGGYTSVSCKVVIDVSLHLDRGWCRWLFGMVGHHRRLLHWAVLDWCSCVSVAASPAHTEHCTLTTLSRMTNPHSLRNENQIHIYISWDMQFDLRRMEPFSYSNWTIKEEEKQAAMQKEPLWAIQQDKMYKRVAYYIILSEG